ncbi:MAG: dockerin type I domain-containing protein [Betaproteobacteria bacterium]
MYSPLSCITGVPVPPSLEQYVRLDACPGAALTVSATDNAIFIPGGCTLVGHAAPQLLAAASRKTHGSAGPFDRPLDTTRLITGLVTVESRRIGASGHLLVFRFNTAITKTGVASAVDSSGAAVNLKVAYAGNEVLVTLPVVPDNRRIAVTLDGVNGSSNITAAMGFLAGDVNNSRAIDAFDLAAVRAHTGQTVDMNNFMYDIKTSGSVNAADLATVKARQGVMLAP